MPVFTMSSGSLQNKLAALLSLHPSVKSIDKKIAATKTGVKLAEQKYQPTVGS